MFESFLIGTKQRKAWKEKGTPKPSELGPVSGMIFHSTAMQAKRAMNKSVKKRNESEGDQHGDKHATEDAATNDILPPHYSKIWRIVEVVGVVNDECKFIGFQLLNLCTINDDKTLICYQKRQIDKLVQCARLVLQMKPKNRSVNMSQNKLCHRHLYVLLLSEQQTWKLAADFTARTRN